MRTLKENRESVRDLIYNWSGCALHEAESLTGALIQFERDEIDDVYIRQLAEWRQHLRPQFTIDEIVKFVCPQA
mgnify:CR=1 FL=1